MSINEKYDPPYHLTKFNGDLDVWQWGGNGKYKHIKRYRGGEKVEYTANAMFLQHHGIHKSYDLSELEGVATMECLEPKQHLVSPGVYTRDIDLSDWLREPQNI